MLQPEDIWSVFCALTRKLFFKETRCRNNTVMTLRHCDVNFALNNIFMNNKEFFSLCYRHIQEHAHIRLPSRVCEINDLCTSRCNHVGTQQGCVEFLTRLKE